MHLAVRSTEVELMDNPDVSIHELKNTFLDINRSNAMLGGNDISIHSVWNLVKNNLKKSYTILDMGCGDGYMLRKTALLLRKKKIKGVLIGMDLREDILAIAREASQDFPEIQFIKQDVLALDASKFQCDILLCTLTMHHFTNAEIIVFLNKFVSISRLGIVINDLHRSKLACFLFKIFRIFFLKTHMAKIDGLISIKRGFLKSELEDFAKKIPNVIHRIRWKWAFRYVWVLETNRQN